MLIPNAEQGEITPAMLSVIWVIADELDGKRLPDNVTDAVWLEVPSKHLRNPDGRSDNFWLRKCFKRLMSLHLTGEYRGDPWGAVMLSEYEIKQGGSLVRLLIPPAAVRAIRSPSTFAKIETHAAHQLRGAAKRLYGALADKKRMGNRHWTYDLEDLRSVLHISGQYDRWADFRRYVLKDAVDQINDYGTVRVQWSPIKTGRSVTAVRFDWEWKNLDEIRDTDTKNEHHSSGRNQDREQSEAAPLTDAENDEAERQKQVEADKAEFRAWRENNPGGSFMQFMDRKAAG